MTKKILFSSIFITLLNATTVNIKIPKTPEVPKVEAVVPTIKVHNSGSYKTNEQILEEFTKEKEVKFSNHVAPYLVEETTNSADTDTKIQVGDIKNGRVSAYLHTPLLSKSDVITKLKDAGFSVLATYKVDKKGYATSIVFTNEALIKAASKSNKGFASALHITIDKKDKLISITNPIYTLAAFLQDDYDKTLALQTLQTLRDTFANLENSDEMMKFRILKHYQFMNGMPKYEDMQIIKKAPTATLLAKAKKSKKFVYQIDLLNGSHIVGVKLGKRTSKFIKKIGYKNAGLLPYPVLLENGEAKILDPKYYIAIMYPMLKMSQFMTIATVPGAINKDIDRIFR